MGGFLCEGSSEGGGCARANMCDLQIGVFRVWDDKKGQKMSCI